MSEDGVRAILKGKWDERAGLLGHTFTYTFDYNRDAMMGFGGRAAIVVDVVCSTCNRSGRWEQGLRNAQGPAAEEVCSEPV